jgi:hypothetical protein
MYRGRSPHVVLDGCASNETEIDTRRFYLLASALRCVGLGLRHGAEGCTRKDTSEANSGVRARCFRLRPKNLHAFVTECTAAR